MRQWSQDRQQKLALQLSRPWYQSCLKVISDGTTLEWILKPTGCVTTSCNFADVRTDYFDKKHCVIQTIKKQGVNCSSPLRHGNRITTVVRPAHVNLWNYTSKWHHRNKSSDCGAFRCWRELVMTGQLGSASLQKCTIFLYEGFTTQPCHVLEYQRVNMGCPMRTDGRACSQTRVASGWTRATSFDPLSPNFPALLKSSAKRIWISRRHAVLEDLNSTIIYNTKQS